MNGVNRMGRGNNSILQSEQKGNYFVGPLNLDRITRQAVTAMGTELALDKNEFDALDMLASKENQYLTFNQLYEAIWGNLENQISEGSARSAFRSLIEKVNNAGGEFMWIEHMPDLGYTLKTRWGNNWKKKSIIKVYTPRETEDEAETVKEGKVQVRIIPRLLAALADA